LVYFIIVLAYLFGAIAVIAVALIGVSFTRTQRDRIPMLRRLDGKKLQLVIIAVACYLLNYALLASKDILTMRQAVDIITLPNGGIAQRATDERFKNEIQNRAAQLTQEAFDYFRAGTRDLLAQRYRDATLNYSKSVSLIPTMSGYLNLAVSQWLMEDLKAAEKSLRTGLVVAQNNGDKEFVAHFYGNLSFFASRDGNQEEAKHLISEALKIFTQNNRQSSIALSLMTLGALFTREDNYDEALKYFKRARAIYDSIEEPLMHGMTLIINRCISICTSR